MTSFTEQKKRLGYNLTRPAGAYLAGGAVNSAFTGRKVEDFDYYFKNEASFIEAVRDAYDDGYWCVHASDRSVTFSDGGTIYQYMHFEFFDDAAKVFDAFDFTVCMGAWDIDAKDFVLHETFLTDCTERKLRFHGGTRFPIVSSLRVLKYQDRNYSIAREEILKLALCCAGVEMRSWEDLEHQIGGLYGNRTKIARDGDFTIAKAVQAISVASDDEGMAANDDDRPGYMADADALLKHLGFAIAEAAE